MKSCLIFILVVLLFGCEFSENLGKVVVDGNESVYFLISQKGTGDPTNEIYYSLIVANDTLFSDVFLLGLDDELNDTRNFYASQVHDMIYLTYYDSTVVCAIYDLKSNYGYPLLKNFTRLQYSSADSLLNELKVEKTYLKSYW